MYLGQPKAHLLRGAHHYSPTRCPVFLPARPPNERFLPECSPPPGRSRPPQGRPWPGGPGRLGPHLHPRWTAWLPSIFSENSDAVSCLRVVEMAADKGSTHHAAEQGRGHALPPYLHAGCQREPQRHRTPVPSHLVEGASSENVSQQLQPRDR